MYECVCVCVSVLVCVLCVVLNVCGCGCGCGCGRGRGRGRGRARLHVPCCHLTCGVAAVTCFPCYFSYRQPVVDVVRREKVPGRQLSTMALEDLMGDLGMSKLQAKRLLLFSGAT
jgi:hypothetical protein